MHPELITGAWVGFNDRRVAFRSSFWGQGAHNALFLVGSYFRNLAASDEIQISNERFPRPEEFDIQYDLPQPGDEQRRDDDDRRVGW
jgi:penicillin-binding protein 1A